MRFALIYFYVFEGAYCLVTVQDTVSVTIPTDLPSGVPFYEIIAVDNATGLRTQDGRFKILRTTAFGQTDVTKGPDVFTLQHMMGNVYMHLVSDGVLLDFTNFTFSVEIQGSTAGDSVKQNLTLVVNVVDWGQNPCALREELCFSSSELLYKIPESLHVGTVIGYVKPTSAQHFCPGIQHMYRLPPTAGPLAVDERSGKLYISHELDFESVQRYDLDLSCQVMSSSDTNEAAFFTTDVTLLVKDVDDNAPYLQQSTSSLLEMDASFISAGKALPQYLNVLDKDSHEVNNISVTLIDPLSLFSVKEIITFSNAIQNEMLISAVVASVEQFSFPEETYNFSAVFTDEGLITNEQNKVVFHVVITNKTHSTSVHYKPPKDLQFAVNISRNAEIYARVTQPLQVVASEGYRFHLEARRMRRTFWVTPKTGIIYVKNHTLLRTLNVNTVLLNLTWRHIETSVENHCIVAVNIFDSEFSGNSCGTETSGCAMQDNEDSCGSSCGKGSPDGFCKWRGHPDSGKIVQEYATCSPDFGTCPDGICDELEAMDIVLCPQDCTNHIVGEGFLSPTRKGILSAAGRCSCNEFGHCSCISSDHSPGNRTRLETRNRLRGKDHQLPNGSTGANSKNKVFTSSTHFNGGEETSSCGPKCLITIGVTSISIVILTVSVIAFRCVRKSQDQHKYVGNRVPLTAVTSDYVDHTAAAAAASGAEIRPDPTQDRCMISNKWEFPRDRLVCKETLGEGEFGRVIKAQAWEIGGRPGYTTVAVKMIKESGTDSEVQDLISEFNLLKEVSHPNIIQLLGACTLKGGQLYIIVEYAEHGSLRNYLRKLRVSQEASRNRTVCNPAYFEEDSQTCDSGLRKELFSFAWQISKGMAYLADMKVVHRDLAARNILLMENKIIKISDFGLSRDVYEGDTYLKTTKSRVPVKWMAVESLGDHVYTTKSDVWSFGIVLWELITLGASPYPGIMPEGLYHLLKEGYRMPQPENCPRDFYQIMFSCWRVIPGERPSFKELVQKLERLLHDTVEYLPLSPEEARANSKCSDVNAAADAAVSLCQMMIMSSAGESSRSDGFFPNGSGSGKRSKISKTSLHLPRIPDTNYESRRLLQTPSEESTSA